jgi:hypothetical protein
VEMLGAVVSVLAWRRAHHERTRWNRYPNPRSGATGSSIFMAGFAVGASRWTLAAATVAAALSMLAKGNTDTLSLTALSA